MPGGLSIGAIPYSALSQDAWSPARLGVLDFWYSPESLPGGDGDSVDRWNDRSGNGRHLIGAAAAPNKTLNAFGGYASATFSTGDAMVSTGPIIDWAAGARTMAVIYQHDQNGLSPMSIFGITGGNDGAGGDWFMIQARADIGPGDPYFAGWANDTNVGDIDTAIKIAVVSYDGTALDLYENLRATTPSTGSTRTLLTDSGFLSVGHSQGASAPESFGGNLLEMIGWSSTISDNDLELLCFYASARYGMTVST